MAQRSKKKLSQDDLVAVLASEFTTAIGGHDGTLSKQIEDALNYYLGKPYGDEVEGKSQFVTQEVLETIEGMLPYLMKVFFSSDMACIFDPQDEEDVPGAEQETEYVNWVFYKQNRGFTVGYNWIKDALMNKIGIVKVVREGNFGPEKRVYKNQTEEQVQMLLSDLGEDELEDIALEVDPKTGTYDVTLLLDKQDHSTKIYNVPPENFRISDASKDTSSAYYVGEVYTKTISELREMGLKVPDDISDADPEGTDFDSIKQTRIEDIDDTVIGNSKHRRDPASREVNVHEEYIRIDADGDGYTELLKVIRVGTTILEKTEVECQPYYTWSPYPLPHRLHGLSAADLAMPVQRLKSRLLRNVLDNQFLANNGRYAVLDGQVNLDDLMQSAPHGIVRENVSGAVRELPTPQLGADAFNVLSYTDNLLEKRTGVSDRSTGLDPRQFNSNTAASTAELVMTAAEQKIELVARIFAEMGLKELFLAIHRLGLKFEKPGVKIQNFHGEFVAVNPDEWRKRNDMTVTVGIGNGSKTHQLMQMSHIQMTQQAIVAGGGLGTIVTPTNIYNLAVEQARVLGRKDVSKFYSKPESDEIPDPGPSIEEQAKLLKAQTDQMKAEAEIKLNEIKATIEAAKLKLEEDRLEFEKAKLAFEEKKQEDENTFRLLEAKIELKQNRAALLGKERK